MEAASGASMTIDKSQYYILDKQIERAGLGKNVSCIKFYNGSSVKCPTVLPAAAQGSMDDSESQLEAASSSASQLAAAGSSASQLEAAPRGQPAADPRRQLSNLPSDPEEPKAKRQCLLSKTLNELREGIIEVAEKGQ